MKFGRKGKQVLVVALVVVGVFLTLLLLGKVSDPPITTMVEEVPEALGYMRFMLGGRVEGTVFITQELRVDERVIDSLVYTTPISIANVNTDTVGMKIFMPMESAVTEPTEVWLKAEIVGTRILHTPYFTADGIWYTDLETPSTIVDEEGFYLVKTIEVYKYYFPFVAKQ